ncbi:MAG: FxLYD domain-containing protein [Planctomycetes bacterium]|nr:FxLYD domain-containing protein [Planctomycetota bacterium]
MNSTDDLAVSFFYRYTGQGGQLIDSTGIAAGNRGTSFVVPVERGTGLDTGIAWAPTQASDVPNTRFDFQATLVDGAGNVIQHKAIVMEGHSASFFSELFDAVPDEFVGRIGVDLPESLYLAALRLESAADQFQLTSVPPERLLDQPGGPKNFEVDYDSLLWPTSYMFTGRVKNLTVADALFPSVSVAFYDADDNFLGGGSDFITGKTRSVYDALNTDTCLRPGETGYFSISMSPFISPKSIDHFEMFVTVNEVIETADPVGRVELVKLSQINYGGKLELRGTIANTGTGDAERVRLRCFILDDAGRGIGWNYITPTVDYLAPGQSVGFMKTTQVPYSDVAEVVSSLVWQAVSAVTAQTADAETSAKLNRREEVLTMRERFAKEHPDAPVTTEKISGTIPRK